jgi:transcription elongation factor Elf1
MAIEIYEGLKFGQMTVLRLNEEATKKIKNKAKIYDLLCSCGKTKTMRDNHIRRAIQQNKNTTCDLCYTFEDWCLYNNHQDYLDLFDQKLNNKRPYEISKFNGKKYWFKCPRGIHESHQVTISHLTMNRQNLSCKACGSFGQYLLDTYGNLDIWSKRNTIDPFTIGKNRNRKDGYVILNCPHCNKDTIVCCQDVIRNGKVPCDCNDGISFPNKFICSILMQLDIDYKAEKIFDWAFVKSENNKLNGRKIYDFYIPSKNMIIEVHGMQHYSECFSKIGGRKLVVEQANDKIKKELALSNGIKYYIEIDCRYSELEWIKNSISNSSLPKILNFDTESVDWVECQRFALSNRVKEACNLWNAGLKSTMKIGENMGFSFNTISSYLKKGSLVGWCDYDSDIIKYSPKLGSTKEVFVYKDDLFLGKFNNAKELSIKSLELFDVYLDRKSITGVCNGNYPYKTYKGFTFKYYKQT